MDIVFEKGDTVEAFFKLASEFVDEGSLVFGQECFGFSGVDPSQICFLGLRVDRKHFKKYFAENEKVGLDFNQAVKILSGADFRSSEVGLSLKDNQLVVRVRGKLEQVKFLPTIDISEHELPEIKVDFKAIVEIEPKAFLLALKELKKVSSHCSLVVKNNVFYLTAKSGVGENSFSFSKDSKSLFSIEGEAATMYPIDYLTSFLKNITKAEKCKVCFSKGSPVLIETVFLGLNARFFLAPRISTGEEDSESQVAELIKQDFERAVQKEEQAKPKEKPMLEEKLVPKEVKKEAIAPVPKAKKGSKKERLSLVLNLNAELSDYVRVQSKEKDLSFEKFVEDCIATDKTFNEAEGKQ